MAERRRRQDDAGVSEFVATILLAAMVVLMGGAVSALVAANLSRVPPPSATLSLAGVEPGDTTLTLLYRSGERLPLGSVALQLERSGATAGYVPAPSWVTPNAEALRPGDTLAFALASPIASGESVTVRVVHNASGTALAQLSARASTTTATASSLGAATLAAHLTPDNVVADGQTGALLTVRVSHPAGAAAVAQVTADLWNLTRAGGSATSLLALNDRGQDGDAVGADGNWSGLVRAPANTSIGTYNITINATDIAGAQVGSTWAELRVTLNVAGAIGNLTTILGNATNVTAVLANLTNVTNLTCYGCIVGNGSGSYEGTRMFAPTSAGVNSFKLRNWTYDRQTPNRLDGDALVGRVIGNTYAWSFYVRFEYQSNLPTITRLEMWNANTTTIYVPTSSYVSMTNLDLDLLNPTAHGFTCDSGCAPQMTYRNANVEGNPTFLIAWMRDETNNFQTDELGIYSVDSVIS